ncbi:MAG: sel1 repeat family protein [Clostridiales bacterium]|nr:sel1 repeat family protein [Clostridiales bacterium]
MSEVRVIILYSNKLESISVDGEKMEGISVIEDKPISEWFSPSGGRDGWEGLITEIKNFIDDNEADLKFEFYGAQEYKNTFENYLQKYGFDCGTNGISEEEINRRNMKSALKQEHKGLYNEAFKLYLSAANSGSAEAQYKVAEYYFSIYKGENDSMGIAPKKAISEAVNYYREAAKQNHTDSQMKLYEIYSKGIGVAKDTRTAAMWLVEAAENGNKEAKAKISNYGISVHISHNKEIKDEVKKIYSGYKETDTSVKKVAHEEEKPSPKLLSPKTESPYSRLLKPNDKTESPKFSYIQKYTPPTADYTKSDFKKIMPLAGKGDVEAQNIVGECYKYGYGVGKDAKQAEYWFKRAAEKNYAPACVNFGDCHFNRKSYSVAIKYYIEAANQGYDKGQYKLAECYYKGCGVVADRDEAVKWCRMAAKQECEEAKKFLNELGEEISDGSENTNSAESPKLGEVELISLANKGNAKAQNKLGELYFNRDMYKAEYWFEKAANQSYTPAITNLGDVYRLKKRGNDFIKFYTTAANSGDIKAQERLAECYEKGIGVKKDRQEAAEWHKRALEAKERLENKPS